MLSDSENLSTGAKYMRLTYLALLIPVVVGCGGGHADVPCVQDTNCDLTTGGKCIASTGNMWCAYPDPACPGGYRYSDQSVGDGLAGVCVPSSGDAGVDAPHDGPMPDAALGDIVATGQAADLVLGQSGYTSNTNGTSTTTIQFPAGLAVSESGGLWMYDAGNSRVLRWATEPTSNGQAADLVLAEPSFTANAGQGVSATSVSNNGGQIATATGHLLVADPSFNRVLIFSPQPTSNDVPASIVLGQTSMTTMATGNGASNLTGPSSVWTNGTKVVVADRANRRILIWNTFPTANAAPADLVLGQTGFGVTAFGAATASNITPVDVYSDGTKLYASDYAYNRVMIWNTFPTTNNQPADVVIGATSATVNGSLFAEGVTVSGDNLFVAEMTKNRVLVYSPIPTAAGASPHLVLGQSDFTGTTAGTTATALSYPKFMTVHNKKLYVSDDQNNRVLRYSLAY